MASEANEVGESGEKKALSCPATMEVFFQSMRMLAIRKRASPKLTPLGVFGDPPAKSSCRFPEVRGPGQMRTKYFEADFRLPQGGAKSLSGHIRNLWNRPGGNVLTVQVSAIAEQIQQHDARQPDAIL